MNHQFKKDKSEHVTQQSEFREPHTEKSGDREGLN